MKKEYNGQSKKGGVYQIRNLINEKVYVGSAKCFQVRASQHESRLNSGKHSNKHLLASWKKWGSNSFLFEILEVVEGDKLQRTTIEKRYLQKYYENWEKCYNFQKNPICKQGPWSYSPTETKAKIRKAKIGKKLSKSHRNNISQNRPGSKICYAVNVCTGEIKKYKAQKKASKDLEINEKSIRMILLKKRKTAKNWTFVTKKNDINNVIEWAKNSNRNKTPIVVILNQKVSSLPI